jgi:GIY-YIG catalytic domain
LIRSLRSIPYGDIDVHRRASAHGVLHHLPDPLPKLVWRIGDPQSPSTTRVMLQTLFSRLSIALIRHRRSGLALDRFGWDTDPVDADGIVRSRTKTGQLRVWRFPRSSLGQVNGKDFAGELTHPGLYILTEEGQTKAYVGESGDLKKRLRDHSQKGPKELPNWTDITVIGDGRSFYQSIFTEVTMRLSMEKAIIQHLKEGGILQPVNTQTDPPRMSVGFETVASALDDELVHVLTSLGITKPVAKRKEAPSEPVRDADLKKLLVTRKMTVQRTGKYEWEVDNETWFVSAGTKPRPREKGWHITFGITRSEDLSKGKGGLIVSRGRGYVVPAKELAKWLKDNLWSASGKKEKTEVYADLNGERLWHRNDYPTLDLNPFRLT